MPNNDSLLDFVRSNYQLTPNAQSLKGMQEDAANGLEEPYEQKFMNGLTALAGGYGVGKGVMNLFENAPKLLSSQKGSVIIPTKPVSSATGADIPATFSGPAELSEPNMFPERKVGEAADYIHNMVKNGANPSDIEEFLRQYQFGNNMPGIRPQMKLPEYLQLPNETYPGESQATHDLLVNLGIKSGIAKQY